jgi:hypothetical protein
MKVFRCMSKEKIGKLFIVIANFQMSLGLESDEN